MKKRISWFLILSIIIYTMTSTPFHVLAADVPKVGYISIYSDKCSNTQNFVSLVSNDSIYLGAEDISKISGYELTVGDFLSYSKDSGLDIVTTVDIEFDGNVSAMGKKYMISVMKYEENVYLPLEQMLYLLHTQWWMEENVLMIQTLPYTIIDFLGGENFFSLLKNKVNQTDLLLNGESKLGHALRTSLASVFNDFDPMMFVLWWPEEGVSPKVNKEYEEALLQIAIDDIDFLDMYGQQTIAEEAQQKGFSSVKSDWDNIKEILDIPENIEVGEKGIDEIAEWLSKESKTNKNLKSKIYSDLSYLESVDLKTWSRQMEGISNIFDKVDILLNIAEVSQRSKKWGSQYIEQISILKDFDNIGYKESVTGRIKKVASQLVNEYQAPIEAAADETALQATSSFLSGVFAQTIFGKYFAVFDAGLAIVKTNTKIKNSIEAADLAYMVDCLVKIEQIATKEMRRCQNKMLDNICTGEFTDKDLRRLRNSTMLSLRVNLRNRSFLYYLNEKLNKNENWENSLEAEKIRQQIIDDYFLICQLMETEKEDKLLLLDTFDNMYCEEYGMIREKLQLEIFHEGEVDSTMERYNAYAEKIEEYESIYGIAQEDVVSNYLSYIKGLGFMKLVDFAHKGVEELLLVYQTEEETKYGKLRDYVYEIWDYNNGGLVLLDSGELFGLDAGVKDIYLVNYNDQTYLVTGGMDDFGEFYFQGFHGDDFGMVREVVWDINENGDIECAIDGRVVSYKEMKQEMEKWFQNMEEYNLSYDIDKIFQQNNNTRNQLGMDNIDYQNIRNVAKKITKDTTIYEAYLSILNLKEQLRYTLYDIDKDSIPELMLYDNAGTVLHIYGYDNGELWDYGELYTPYESIYSYPDNGLIIPEGGTGTVCYFVIYKEGKYLLQKEDLYLYCLVAPSQNVEEYFYNGEPIDEQQFAEYEKQLWINDLHPEFYDINDLELLDTLFGM